MQAGFRAEQPLGYQQITSLVAATGLTVPAGTSTVIITPEGGNCRWRDDNVNPTGDIGYPLTSGSELVYQSASPQRMKFINATGQTVTALNVTYYGGR